MGMSRFGRPRDGARIASFSGLLLASATALATLLFPAPASAQVSILDARFEDIRKASVAWDNRPGPTREILDVVCLVPDLPTYLEAIATWDQGRFFPVLIDDVEYTFKFLRAFRPARVVRYPGRAAALPPEKLWDAAVAAVGKSWTAGETAPLGNVRPESLGALPPGVVLSHGTSPSLAGAVALAAGRFQPLLRWETADRTVDVLPTERALELMRNVETVVAAGVSRYDALGDDCDFVTLAGDYPYRYQTQNGPNAFDDLILRSAKDGSRWAYAGRITGDPVRSAYVAMCSLFLQPSKALLYNAYDEKNRPWSDYSMAQAIPRVEKLLPVTHRSGPKANLTGWHETFDPFNTFGLLILNTHGHPTQFHLDSGPGQTADIPESGPLTVLMIHSFSAESPDDPDTLAGRWLVNGAYAYFGAVNEPFLDAFRTPTLVSTFLAENLPIVVSQRKTITESRGLPWRLVYLGDPLLRVKPLTAIKNRSENWGPVGSWPRYGEFRAPAGDAPESLRLNWAIKTGIHALQTGTVVTQKVDLADVLLSIARDRLDPALKPVYDDLLVDTLRHASRSKEMIDRLAKIPPAERSPAVRRHLETAQLAALQLASTRKDFRQAVTVWNDVIQGPGSRDFVRCFTERVARLAEGPAKQDQWLSRVRGAEAAADPANRPIIEAEKKRLEVELEKARAAK